MTAIQIHISTSLPVSLSVELCDSYPDTYIYIFTCKFVCFTYVDSYPDTYLYIFTCIFCLFTYVFSYPDKYIYIFTCKYYLYV